MSWLTYVSFHPDTQFFVVRQSVTLLGKILKVRRVILVRLSSLVILFTKGNRFYEYPSLSNGVVSRFLWAVKVSIFQRHADPLRTRRRVQYKVYEDMWSYIGGERRLPGPCQFSHNSYWLVRGLTSVCSAVGLLALPYTDVSANT